MGALKVGSMGKGMSVKVEGKSLVITLPVSRGVSASGKSIVIASTRGNIKTGVIVEGKELVIGVNAYIPNE